MKNQFCHIGAEVILRNISHDEFIETLAWRNRDENRIQFIHDSVISLEAHQRFYESYEKKSDDYIFLVTNQNEDKIGMVSLYDIKDKTAEFGRMLANPKFTGKKLMKEALKELLLFAKNKLKLEKLILVVKKTNHKAIYIYESLGFKPTESKDDLITMEIVL